LKPITLVTYTFFNEEETKKALCDFIMGASKLSMGVQCRAFEKEFSHYQKSKHCTLFSSGSTANLALVQALINLGKIKQGDLVGVSALTWSTNVMPLIQLGLRVYPIDVELETLNMSSRILKEALKKKPEMKMLFLTNALGFCSDMDKISDLCKERGIVFIEDNCESLGTVYKGKKLGSFGLAGTFSFYVGHHMSTIEGGAVCTNSKRLDTMLKMVRDHGLDRNIDVETQSKLRKKHNLDNFYARFTFYTYGYNLRPTEITGFLGLNQLKYIDKIVQARKSNFLNFISAVDDRYIYPLKYDHIDVLSNFSLPVVCRSKEVLANYLKRFGENAIEIRPIISGDITRQLIFKKYFKGEKFDIPNTRTIHDLGFYIGNNADLTKEEIGRITSVLRTHP